MRASRAVSPGWRLIPYAPEPFIETGSDEQGPYSSPDEHQRAYRHRSGTKNET